MDENTVSGLAARLAPRLVEIRRELHQHPEVGNREFETSRRVAGWLQALGLPFQAGVAKTGVVALLEGAGDGPTVAVRADLDALPIQESLEVPYRSQTPGLKHACGHDVHTAVVLGVAETLRQLRKEWRGRVKFIFQPAEEGAPDGEYGGAYLMRDEGVLKNPDVEAIFGLHVAPFIDAGCVGYSSGAAWASNDSLEIIIHGKQTHGAYPHTGVDAIAVAAQVQLALQTMINRSVDVQDPLLVSFGIIEGGNQYNVIADRVRLSGMFRTLNPETRKAAPARIEKVLQGVTAAFGASYSFKMTSGAPACMNNPQLVSLAVPLFQEILGSENVLLKRPQMGAEDFAVFAELVPAFYFQLGSRNESRGITHMLHTPEFDVDEACIPVGVNLMSQLVLRYLGQAR